MILTQTGRQGSNPLHNQDIHPTDLSPLSSGSGSSVRSDSQTSSPSPTNSSKESNMIGTQLLQALNNGRSGQHFQTNDLSPLQRLQFAFERTSILSNLFPAKEGRVPLDDHQSTPLSSPHFREGQGVMSLSSPSQVETDEGRQNEPLGSPNSDPANIFQCPLCALPCNGRHSFNEHLVTHTTQNACPKCDYLTSSEETLRDHLLQEHDMDDPTQAVMEEDASVPKLNAQGKVKTFKCKQCGHLSLTKAESWTHSASHIRPEKMLKCPKCTFVTEYKHHLEYHLRLHVGSKPYQCNVCPYTCVNKSMLNSHLKSHSAVYQYNCMDCDYQTKYCHSLKMHLRKLNHKPSMVLNPDGTPNPLPIIDVYGTRRGPKMKKSQPNAAVAKPETYPKIPQTHFQNQPASYLHSPANSSSNHSSFSSHGSRDSLDQISPQINPLEEAPKPKGRKPKNGPPYPLKRSLASGESSSSDGDHIRIQRHTDGDAGTKAIDGFEPASEQLFNKSVLEIRSVYAAALNQYLLSNPLVFGPGGPEHLARVAREQERRMAEQLQVQNGLQFHNKPVRMHEINGQRVVPPPGGPIQNSVALDLRHPKSESERRRRKGKAHRYERHAYEDDMEQSEGEMALDFSNNNNYKSQAQKHYKMDEEREEVNGGSLMCKYCEISFPDQVLYQMHMSYHSGETDPFVCKSCGKRTQDKVSFFLHLTTDSH